MFTIVSSNTWQPGRAFRAQEDIAGLIIDQYLRTGDIVYIDGLHRVLCKLTGSMVDIEEGLYEVIGFYLAKPDTLLIAVDTPNGPRLRYRKLSNSTALQLRVQC